MMKITKRLSIVLKSLLSLQMGEVETDKGVLIYDGELAEGTEVFVRNAEDEIVPANDGEYMAEDKVIVVENGVVKEIKEKSADGEQPAEEPVEEPVEEQPIVEEEETPAPVDEPETNEEPVAEEDRIAALEERVEAIVAGINEIVNSIAALEGRIAEVEGKLAKVEAPAADPIDETEVEETKKTRLSYLRK